jgi:hypothetical protein
MRLVPAARALEVLHGMFLAVGTESRLHFSEGCRFRDQSIARMLLILPVLLSISSCASCAGKRTACDGLVYKAEGPTRSEYLPCAGEIVQTLDRLRPDLEAVVNGDKTARSKAHDEYNRLNLLIERAGGRDLIEGWGDEDLNRLNVRIWNAYTSYGAVLLYPNAADLQGAEADHDEAKDLYESLR